VLLGRIELPTSSLPMMCSTTELQQQHCAFHTKSPHGLQAPNYAAARMVILGFFGIVNDVHLGHSALAQFNRCEGAAVAQLAQIIRV
jgi:hypothetical protein